MALMDEAAGHRSHASCGGRATSRDKCTTVAAITHDGRKASAQIATYQMFAKERSLLPITRHVALGTTEKLVQGRFGHGSHASCDIDVYKQRSTHRFGCHDTSSAQNGDSKSVH